MLHRYIAAFVFQTPGGSWVPWPCEPRCWVFAVQPWYCWMWTIIFDHAQPMLLLFGRHPKTKKTQHSCLKRALLQHLSPSLSLLSVITRRDACRKWVGEWIHEGCTAFSDITGFPVFFPGRISTLVLSPCGAGRRSHPNQSVHYCTLYPFWYPVFLPTRIRYSGTYSACLLSFPDFVAAQSIRIALG